MAETPKSVIPGEVTAAAETPEITQGGGGEGPEENNESDMMEVDFDSNPQDKGCGDTEKSEGGPMESAACGTGKGSGDGTDLMETEKGVAQQEKVGGDTDFVVLEEDDDDGSGEEDAKQNEEQDEVETLKGKIESVTIIGGGKTATTTENGGEVGEKSENKECKTTPENGQQEPEMILANPLFGKSALPVINLSDEDGSSSGSDNEDFTENVQVNNFESNGILKKGSGENAGECQGGTDCFQEKGILIGEIERLRKAVTELNNRHSVLEDFIHVEYSDKFKTFLKNREHLMTMGFGGTDADLVTGKRSAKSSELVELLIMIKEQSDLKTTTENKSTPKSKPVSGNQQGSQQRSVPSLSSQNKSAASKSKNKGSGGGTDNKQFSKPQLIPSVNSSRNRKNTDWAETYPPSNSYPNSGYSQRPDVEMIGHVRGTVPPSYQSQQQLVAQQQQLQAAAEARYQDTMYANVINGRDGPLTAVERSNLYQSGPAYNSGGYGGNTSSEHLQERKRKRGSSNNVPNPIARPLDFARRKKCPMCPSVLRTKSLKHHLMTFHSPVKMACPVCREEFGTKKKLTIHMREMHDIAETEGTLYAASQYANIEKEAESWVRRAMNEAKTPTKEQIEAQLKFNEEQKRLGNVASVNTSSSRTTSSSGERIFTGSRRLPAPASDLYGPGGYAQYASRYLQERSGAGNSNRLYTPF